MNSILLDRSVLLVLGLSSKPGGGGGGTMSKEKDCGGLSEWSADDVIDTVDMDDILLTESSTVCAALPFTAASPLNSGGGGMNSMFVSAATFTEWLPSKCTIPL